MADADRKQRRGGKKQAEGRAGDLLTCVKGVKRGRVRGRSGAQGGRGISGGNSSLSIGHSLVTRGEILEGEGGNRERRKVSLPSLSPVIAFLFSSSPHPPPPPKKTPDFQARGHLNELLRRFLFLVKYSLLIPSTLATNRPDQLIGILINSGRKPRFIRVKPLFTKIGWIFFTRHTGSY